ncbi:LLM class flavin-dependent oxidoreductase [Nostocoides sp. HKS02]|uniref:LLM class flavin-dependent oxidoreductase n=1 Tax=Nostocoides sp. HKS02 TaxID=1813880 RepID=UPI001E55DCCC|nr:LLM class flavin-dependent oxidoreductase [Tetrasphaera sp. HKS02]
MVGAGGSGKSTWAAEHYRAQEVVSSDALRAVVGSGEGDLDASADAFAVLEQIITARLRRGLTVVVDTLGLDPAQRSRHLALGRAAGLPCVAVLFDTPPAVCRERNAQRDRPVPAAALGRQLAQAAAARDQLEGEAWDWVAVIEPEVGDPAGTPTPTTATQTRDDSRPLDVVLQIGRFPWREDPAGWLRSIALAADEAGFSGLALMDHLIQIPQVDRAWEPIPEPWVTLGLVAGLDTDLRLGTLVSPVTFRQPGIIAKTVATLDVLSGGRAFLGLGAGWWEREHLAFGIEFPPVAERLDQLELCIETVRALWAKGTKAHTGSRVSLPETTAYPRPVGQPEIIVGGSGERRTLRIAAQLADACNLPSELGVLDHKMDVLRRHCLEVGRDPDEVAITVLDLPVVGTDRDDTWRRVERLRGRTAAASFAERHHAGDAAHHRDRYRALADRGVRTVFLAVGDLDTAEDIARLAPVLDLA